MPDAPAPPLARQPFWFRRRSLPLPTWRTWCVVLIAGALAAGWFFLRIHPWLAVVAPVPAAPYTVVEGWVPDYVLEEVVDYTGAVPVKRIFTTGVPLERGSFLSEFSDYARLAATSLAKMGVAPGLICPVPAREVSLERTRAMAAALKDVLDAENIPAADRRLNLFTLGTHARRSRLIFQEALGSSWEVGVVAVPSHDYEASRWYAQSAGAKTVIEELIALVMQSNGGGNQVETSRGHP